jgi:type I restriction enzyme M protein
MDSGQHSAIVNFIWGIADDVLRDVYVRGKYRDVILPMTVIRRLDCLLEPTKSDVLARKEQLDVANIQNQDVILCQASGHKFYNTSSFTLRSIYDGKPSQMAANMLDYLDGFSPNVREIIEKFDFRRHVEKLAKEDALGFLLEKYLDNRINLSPEPVLDGSGEVAIPGLSNHSMGYVFEELIRKFNEDNNEEAGEHFTPREVIHLMARMIVEPIANKIESGTYLVYDCACGTGGMLTEAEQMLVELGEQQGKELSIYLHGQEVNAETYAICKADLLIQGEDESKIMYGSTLSEDHFTSDKFDFMLANPPYGKSWKKDQRAMGGKSSLRDPRFVIEHGGEAEYEMIPRSSDGQLLFLVTMLSKMNHSSALGSRVATVHNGSSLFTGDAGSGESNIRRWIIENDWLEAIIGLPENLFYNTGIATYIWVLTNRKPARRKGKVQLIDARQWYTKMRRNLGNKNCEFSGEDLDRIMQAFSDFEENENSRIVSNESLGFWKVTVERPLRYRIDLDEASLQTFKDECDEAGVPELFSTIELLAADLGEGPHMNYAKFLKKVKKAHKEAGHKWRKTTEQKTLESGAILAADSEAEAVIARKHKDGTIDYEPDSNLRDTEQIPLDYEGGIDGYMEAEVFPHVEDAWVDHDKTKIGYEIPFTRFFYTYEPPRPLDVIEDEIRALEDEIQGLLKEVLV